MAISLSFLAHPKSPTNFGTNPSASISPDGRFVAYVESEQGEQSLWLRQLATGQTLRLIPSRRVAYRGHTFTRDGNSIVFGLKNPGDFEGSFYSISTLGGTPRRLVSGIDSPPTFSPDGRRMAWVRARHPGPEESALLVANADGTDARVLASVKLPERVAPIFFTAPDWSPDGRRIAMSVVRVESGAVERRASLVAIARISLSEKRHLHPWHGNRIFEHWLRHRWRDDRKSNWHGLGKRH